MAGNKKARENNKQQLKIRFECLKKKVAVEKTLIQVENTNFKLKEMAENLLVKNKIKATVLAVIPSGSHVYGSNIGDELGDYIGIYVSPLEEVLSMTPPVSRVEELGLEQKMAFARGGKMLGINGLKK